MFGELALSERAIATHGILTVGAATADANFTVGEAGNIIAGGSSSIAAPSINTNVGVGILVGSTDTSFNFNKEAIGTRFATGISAEVFSFNKSSAANILASGASDQSANFIHSSAPNIIASGNSDYTGLFVQSVIPIKVASGANDLVFSFSDLTALARIIKLGNFDASYEFAINQIAASLIVFGSQSSIFAFTKLANGALLWERIDADVPTENWIEIVASGETWTPVNANGTIETWIQKVV